MTIRELIKKVRDDHEIVQIKEEECERLLSLCGVQAIQYGERVSSTPNPNRQEQAYMKYIEYRDRFEEFKKSTIENRIKLATMLESLDSALSRDIMYQYCLNHVSFRKLANKYHYSRQNIYKIYNSSCDELDEKFQNI